MHAYVTWRKASLVEYKLPVDQTYSSKPSPVDGTNLQNQTSFALLTKTSFLILWSVGFFFYISFSQKI